MQEPTRQLLMCRGQPLAFASSPILETGRARSGVCGPTMWGSSLDRSSSITRSKNFSGSSSTSGSGRRCSATAAARSA